MSKNKMLSTALFALLAGGAAFGAQAADKHGKLQDGVFDCIGHGETSASD